MFQNLASFGIGGVEDTAKSLPLHSTGWSPRRARSVAGLESAFWPFLPTGAFWRNSKWGPAKQDKRTTRAVLSHRRHLMVSCASPLFAFLCHCLSLFVRTSGSKSFGFLCSCIPIWGFCSNCKPGASPGQPTAVAASALSCQGDWQPMLTDASWASSESWAHPQNSRGHSQAFWQMKFIYKISKTLRIFMVLCQSFNREGKRTK